MIVCAGNQNTINESFSFAKNIGVGLIDSSINLTNIILSNRVSKLIFVGSAGSYDSDIKILDLFFSTNATLIEQSFFMNHSYTPINNQILIKSPMEFQNIKYVTVNSSNYITTNQNFSKAMSKNNILLENMEFFAVARVAQYFKIPFLGIFCVSNFCNSNAHNDFLKNHSSCKDKLIQFIESNNFS